ncbi:MAG TPA: hypothetical protein DCS93_34490 [Microscillaceae bacterium]|nr:hypothetical protein [Microscillaceae bacterium]
MALWLLSITMITSKAAIVKDSLSGVYNKVSYQKPAKAHYLVDMVNYVNKKTKVQIEQVLEYINRVKRKELHVIIKTDAQAVIKNDASNNTKNEANDYSEDAFKKQVNEKNGALLTLYFAKTTIRTKQGDETKYELVTNITAGDNININNDQLKDITKRCETFTTRDDYARGIIYSVHQLILGGENPLQSPEELNEYVLSLGIEINNSGSEKAIKIADVNAFENSSQSAFTMSGRAIDITEFEDLEFLHCSGALTHFTHNGVRYAAVASGFGGKGCAAFTRFWGYYNATKYKELLLRADQKGIQLIKFLGDKGYTTSDHFEKQYWFELSPAKNKSKVRAQKKESIKHFLGTQVNKDFNLPTNCVVDYYWTLNDAGKLDNAKRGNGRVVSIKIPDEATVTNGNGNNCGIGALVAKAATSGGLEPGYGRYIYIHQILGIKSISDKDESRKQEEDLIKYANKVSTFMNNERCALLNFQQKFSNGNHYTTSRRLIIQILKKIDYNTFKQSYTVTFNSRNAYYGNVPYKVLANQDPQIPSNYNSKSKDFTVKDKNFPYTYSIQDLIKRYEYLNTSANNIFKKAIERAERNEVAFPISSKDYTEQYKAVFGTNKAYLAWAQFATDVLGTVQNETLQFIKALASEMSKLVDGAKIPDHWWNPDCKKGVPEKGKVNCNVCKEDYSTGFQALFSLISDETSRHIYLAKFAFYAGLYNGILDEIKGNLDLVSLAAGYYSDKAVRKALDEAIKQLEEKGFWAIIKQEIEKVSCNEFVISHNIGKVTASIAFMFIGPSGKISRLTELPQTFVSKIGQAARGTAKLLLKTKRILKNIGDVSVRVANKSVNVAKEVYEIVVDKSQKVIATIEDGVFKAKEWIDISKNKKSKDEGYGIFHEESLDESLKGKFIAKNDKGEIGICLKNGKKGFTFSDQKVFVELSDNSKRLLKDIKWKQNDGVIDFSVHADGNKYIASIENGGVTKQVDLSTEEIAQIIKNIIPDNQTPIRFLSCSDLNAAKELSAYLNRPVIATDGIVRVHPDGGITTIARSGNSTQKWYKLEGGNQTRVSAPKKPDPSHKNKFVEMGDPGLRVGVFKVGEVYRNIQTAGNTVTIEYFFKSKKTTRGYPEGENITENTKHWIGTYTVRRSNGKTVMEADIHVKAKIKHLYPQDPDMRLGKTMFEDAYQHYTNKYGEIDQMYAGWERNANYEKGLSDNLEEYLDNLNKNMSKEDAALNTNAGRKLSSYGYSKVDKIDDTNPDDVKVWFAKPNSSKFDPKIQAKIDELNLSLDDVGKLTDDMAKVDAQGVAVFKQEVLDNPSLLEAWQALNEANEVHLRTDVQELRKVLDNIEDVKKFGGYKAWKFSVDAFETMTINGEKVWLGVKDISKFSDMGFTGSIDLNLRGGDKLENFAVYPSVEFKDGVPVKKLYFNDSKTEIPSEFVKPRTAGHLDASKTLVKKIKAKGLNSKEKIEIQNKEYRPGNGKPESKMLSSKAGFAIIKEGDVLRIKYKSNQLNKKWDGVIDPNSINNGVENYIINEGGVIPPWGFKGRNYREEIKQALGDSFLSFKVEDY